MAGRAWAIVTALAALMLAISLGLAKAYQAAPPPVIATFDYAYLLFAAFWSYAVFDQPPDLPTVIGLLLIAGAGLLVLERGAAGCQKRGAPGRQRDQLPRSGDEHGPRSSL